MKGDMKSPLENCMNKNLGGFLKEQRQSLGRTQKEIADELQYSTQFISNIERSKCPVPLRTLKQLVTIYNIETGVIIDLLLIDKKRDLENYFSL